MPPSNHPSNSVAPNEFLAAVTELVKATTGKDSAVGKVRAIHGRLEAQGVDMKAFALAMRVRKMEEDAGAMFLRNFLTYAGWMGLSHISRQGELFSSDGPQPNADAHKGLQAAVAYEEGYKAGLAGRRPDDSRWTPGTSFHAKFREGWGDGQMALAEQMGRGEPEEGEVLQPPKRGRKPKAGEEQAAGKPRGRGGRGRRGSSAHA